MSQEERNPASTASKAKAGYIRVRTEQSASVPMWIRMDRVQNKYHNVFSMARATRFDDVDAEIVSLKAADRKAKVSHFLYSIEYVEPAKDTAAKHVQTPPQTSATVPQTGKYAECEKCGAQVQDSCKAYTGAGQTPARFQCNDFRKSMGWGDYGTPAPTYTPKPPPDRREIIARQTVGDMGVPRIPQDELLARDDVKQLLAMLGYMRPAGSKTEADYIEKFIVPLGSTRDKFGNRYVKVMKADGSEPDILFSSHTDTVHHNAGHQQLVVGDGRVWAQTSNCLGADDTVGNWLMIEMIKAKVPGLYIFHREEEKGGNGSRYIKTKHAPKIKAMKAAIAFDRKAYTSIITHQGGQRCCSEKFSQSLSAILGGGFVSDRGGTFTDTKNYVDLIGECTNLSVGYHAQHGPTEWQELSFAVGLKDKLIAADWEKLEYERKPGEVEARSYGFGGGYGNPYGGFFNDAEWTEYWGGKQTTPAALKPPQVPAKTTPRAVETRSEHARRVNAMCQDYGQWKAEKAERDLEDLMSTVVLNPELVAHFLAEKGWTVADIETWYEDEAQDIPGVELWDGGVPLDLEDDGAAATA